MGVDVQGKACGEVTQHTADGLNSHSVLQGDGCEGVAEGKTYWSAAFFICTFKISTAWGEMLTAR